MKETVYEWKFCDNEIIRDSFTYRGAKALYEFLTEMEYDGFEFEFDPVAFRCDFTEYKDFDEIKGVYPDLVDMDDLNDRTMVLTFDDGIIIQNF